MSWSLYENEVKLEPLKFSNGKTQEDVVNEVVNLIKNGEKIIFIKGVCGTGKSAIALNIAKELGGASIVVPIKNLQRQYQDDYSSKKYVYKNEDIKEKLKISMITGRANHLCLYLKENLNNFDFKEKDSSLFDFKKHEKNINLTADNSLIPCKIEINEKNTERIKKYLKENPNWKKKDNNQVDIDQLSRIAVAPACLYWSPILPSDMKPNLDFNNKKSYMSINGEQIIYQRKEGCPYYSQFHSYRDSDAIIFNSRHYLLETYLGRKPSTNVEIIDECDEFLDNFANEGKINLNFLSYESSILHPDEPEQKQLLSEMKEILFEVYKEAQEIVELDEKEFPVKKTKALELIKFFIANDLYKITDDDTNYLLQCVEICRKFDSVLDDTYINFSESKDKKDLSINLVSVNLEKAFKFLVEKNKVFVLMSGTIHSPEVLKEIFGLEKFKIVDAEVVNQGVIDKIRTGFEADFKYSNLIGEGKRIHYLKALNKSVAVAKRPTLVHVNAFSDLPTMDEKEKFSLFELMAQDELKEIQKHDSENFLIRDFKQGKIKILFTTKCSRGVDFPGEMCNSVVITKYPYPDANSLFWRILKKYRADIFWDFYKDKARRELLQRVYRSVRSKDDYVQILSPDLRVLEAEIV